MLRKTLLTAAILALTGSVAMAQEARVELSGTAGWTFSGGVTGDNVTVPGLGVFDAVDPKDAFSWGLRLGYLVTDNVEVGFLFAVRALAVAAGAATSAGNISNSRAAISEAFA